MVYNSKDYAPFNSPFIVSHLDFITGIFCDHNSLKYTLDYCTQKHISGDFPIFLNQLNTLVLIMSGAIEQAIFPSLAISYSNNNAAASAIWIDSFNDTITLGYRNTGGVW